MIEYDFFKDKKPVDNQKLKNTFGKYPIIFDFCTNTQSFFERFSKNKLVREKCSIDILTPEHLKASYEFEIILHRIKRNIYYLFTPHKRLDCLSIMESSNQISICPENKVKDIVRNILSQELQKCSIDLGKREEDIFEDIWKIKHGFPCFIYIENNKNNAVKLFKVSFYMVAEQTDNSSTIENIFLPIQTHSISFQKNIFFFSYGSKWFYISLPEYMEGSLYCNDNGISKEIGKTSVRIKSFHLEKGLDIEKLEMRISNPLCFWFYYIYYMTIILSILLLIPICNIVLTKYLNIVVFDKPGIEKYLNFDLISDLFIITLTSIIATRSFLLTENNMLKKFAKKLPIFSIILTIVYIIIYTLLKYL